MRLLKINDIFQMDVGAPMPIVISNETDMLVIFYDNTDSQKNCVVLRFHIFLLYRFGLPNDEALDAHQYHSLGLEPYGFFELQDSKWLNEISVFNKGSNKWKDYKHYIVTFHDSTFECIAKSFEFRKESDVFLKAIHNLINKDSVD